MNNSYSNDWQKIRNRIIEREDHKCKFCDSSAPLDVHHIRPISMGGTHDDWNLIALCRDCHMQDHRQIKEIGLAVIPGWEWEDYWRELTDHKDVIAYAEKLEAEGLDSEYILDRERKR